MPRYIKLLAVWIVLVIGMPGISYGQFSQYISVQERSIDRQAGSVNIDLDIVLNNLKIASNDYLMLTPALIGQNGAITEFPPVIVHGKKSQQRYSRYVNLTGNAAEAYLVMQVPEKQQYTTIPYRTGIPYQGEANMSELVVVAETCGCGNEPKQREVIPVTRLNLPLPQFTATFIVPAEEPIKERELSAEAYVIFRVNKTDLVPELGDNSEELAKIRRSIDYVNEVKDIEITAITIEAYASPEGPLQNNIRLSEGRAAALRNYILSNYNFNSNLLTSRSKGENWEGLREAVRDSYNFTETQKQDILNIIDIDDLNTRKSRLQSYAGGTPYRNMLANIYPQLRRSEYRIEYTVPAFSVEEGKAMLQTKPEMLSLREMYTIANTYPRGSQDYNQVFVTAARLHPQDVVANVNAAAVELGNNNSANARNYLSAHMNNTQAYNNVGIMYALDGDLEQAERYFQMAASAGNREAADNLQKLKTYRTR